MTDDPTDELEGSGEPDNSGDGSSPLPPVSTANASLAISRLKIALIAGLACVIGAAVAIGALAFARSSPKKPNASVISVAPMKTPTALPDLSSYIPTTERITKESFVHLTAGPTPQVVVTDTATTALPSGLTPSDILLFTWDPYAKRWEISFDADTETTTGAAYSTTTLAPDATPPPGPSASPFLSADDDVTNLTFTIISPSTHETDLAFWADETGGADVWTVVGILYYNGSTVQVAYGSILAPAGTVAITGQPGNQHLALTSQWITPGDPMCCPTKAYSFTVGLLPPSRSHETGPTYGVTSDSRPWLGIYVALSDLYSGSNSPPPNPVVVQVVQGGPAVGVLQPGDQIVGIQGSPVPTSLPSANTAPLWIQLAQESPRQVVTLSIIRNGSPMNVDLTTGSLADPAYFGSIAPTLGFLGVGVVDNTAENQRSEGLTAAMTPGALVVSTTHGDSAAAQAGVTAGDVITSLNGLAVSSAAQMSADVSYLLAFTNYPLTFVDPNGIAHNVRVQLAPRPETDVFNTIEPA